MIIFIISNYKACGRERFLLKIIHDTVLFLVSFLLLTDMSFQGFWKYILYGTIAFNRCDIFGCVCENKVIESGVVRSTPHRLALLWDSSKSPWCKAHLSGSPLSWADCAGVHCRGVFAAFRSIGVSAKWVRGRCQRNKRECLCVYVYVCVCVREREGGRGRKRDELQLDWCLSV